MRIKTLVMGIGIAMAAAVGSAQAADQFTTLDGSALVQSPATGQFGVLDGIPAEVMWAREMSDVVGTGIVSDALAIGAGDPPPGRSGGNFNMSVAGPIWLGKAGGVF